ncbi:MFS transporter [Cupriavidus sp. BIC8F]|uniref:MFS transporter n=2 Tax=Cupriavidus TaxID=106589 RepID=UPI002916B4CE|nr:MFS transporter [Cupriavidus sp. BIC8F]
MQLSTLAAGEATSTTVDRVFRKIAWRLMPILFLGYLFAFLDRINVGYAQLQMKDTLGFSDAVYGLGAGIFFLSYMLCEVPSNMLFERMGARLTFLRIMLLWGLTSAATMFVQTPLQFYIVRFLLGVFEAGFFPGVILYLSYWFPPEWRGRATSAFLFALPIAGVVGGPLSGAIIRLMDGTGGLAGWQWCFLLEGLPTALIGLLCHRFLCDKPGLASWLSADEKQIVEAALPAHEPSSRHGWQQVREVMTERRVHALGLIYFALTSGSYAFAFWLPAIIKGLGVNDPLQIGWYSLPPYVMGAVGMCIVSWNSDIRGERRWHVALMCLLASIALATSTLAGRSLGTSLLLLSIANFGLMGAGAVFWSVAPTALRARNVAVGIALVSSLGILGGFFSPTLIGVARSVTGSTSDGLLLISLMLLTAGAVTVRTLDRGNPAQASAK